MSLANHSSVSSFNLAATISQQQNIVQYPHASQPQRRPPQNQNSHLVVRRLIITVVLFFLVITVVSCIVWLIVHPKGPIFTVKSFTVSNFNLSVDSGIVRADYDIEFSIRNPNKRVRMDIHGFDIRLLYKSTVVKRARMGDIHLDQMSQQYSSPRFLKDSDHPFHRRNFKDIRNDWSRKREVSFIVTMTIDVKFQSGKRLSTTNAMEVSCMDLVVEFLAEKNEEEGKLKSKGGKDCSVN